MPAVELEFALNLSTGRLSESYLAHKAYTLPTLIAGSTVNFRVRLVKNNPNAGPGGFALIALDGLSLTVGIGSPGTPLTSGTLIVDGDALAGSVPLNVGAITGLFGGAVQTVNQTLELRVNDGGLYQPVQFGIKINNSVLAAATVDPQPPEEGLSKNEAAQAYVPRDGGQPGQGFLMKSPSSLLFSIYVNDDGEIRAEKVV